MRSCHICLLQRRVCVLVEAGRQRKWVCISLYLTGTAQSLRRLGINIFKELENTPKSQPCKKSKLVGGAIEVPYYSLFLFGTTLHSGNYFKKYVQLLTKYLSYISLDCEL